MYKYEYTSLLDIINTKYLFKILSPSSDGKPEPATAVFVASDDKHEDARNMLSCI
jgi:hypothetical protein